MLRRTGKKAKNGLTGPPGRVRDEQGAACFGDSRRGRCCSDDVEEAASTTKGRPKGTGEHLGE